MSHPLASFLMVAPSPLVVLLPSLTSLFSRPIQLREIKKSAETSIDTLRSQLTSKEHELEQLRRSGATASTQLPATLPADVGR